MRGFLKRSLYTTFSLFLFYSFVYAGTDIEFALKLTKEGYPELAQDYLNREPVKSSPDQEGRSKAFCEIYLQMARSSSTLKERTEWIKKAVSASSGINRSVREKADFSFSLASQLRLGLKEPGLSEELRTSIIKEVIPYLDEAKTQYKSYVDSNSEKFQEFLDKALDENGQRYLNSKQGKEAINEIYQPFVIAAMRYFECVVDKAHLVPTSDSSRCTGLDKVIEDAETLSYSLEAPVPSATINMYVANIYLILAECGVNSMDNREKAKEKFQEVFTQEQKGVDGPLIREIKAKAYNSLIETSLRSGDIAGALAALDKYTGSSVKDGGALPTNYKFTIDDFEVLLNGILVNANAYAKTEDKDKEKYQRSIDTLKLHLEKAANNHAASGFWNKKIVSYVSEAMVIMGKELSDPLILLQLADDKKNEQKFEEAIPLYEKALEKKLSGPDRMNKKPRAMYSLAYCAYQLKKMDLAAKTMKEFFAEFPYTDARYKKALEEQYIKSSKLYYYAANKQFATTKDEGDKDLLMKSLDLLEVFSPEGAVFIKINTLRDNGNYIDAIKLTEGIKKDSVDYDRALYFRGLAQYYYARDAKAKNEDTHNELSLKMAKSAYATFQEFLEYIKNDKSDIIQEKQDSRKIWERESKKMSAFLLVSMDDTKEALSALRALNDEFKKNKEDQNSGNRLYVLQNLMNVMIQAYNAEKDNAAKMSQITQVRAILDELKGLGLDAYVTKNLQKKPEERKADITSNYCMVIGMMMITNPMKEQKLIAEGSSWINECSKGKPIENLDLYLARKFLDIKDYENASISLEKVRKEYVEKGWSNPLVKEDFNVIRGKLITDESRSFFRTHFELLAVPAVGADGKEIGNTRDYGRLSRNLDYLLADTPIKVPNDAEMKIQEMVQSHVKKDRVWNALKESGDLAKLKKKLTDFLTYLGIIDDLENCSTKNNHFEDAIKYSQMLRTNYPGVISKDKKLADLMFRYGKFLVKDNPTNQEALKQYEEAYSMYMEIRSRAQNFKTKELFNEVDEKRLVTLLMIYKVTKDEKKFEDVITAMRLLYLNAELYATYTDLFAVLEDLGKMPAELKPMTPEEIRAQNEENERLEKEKIEQLATERTKREQEILEKRRLKMVGTDVSFLTIEMADLDNSTFDLYKSYYEKLIDAPKLKSKADEKDLVDAFNKVIIRIDMYKMIPKEILDLKNARLAQTVKEIDDYVKLQGARGEGTVQMISLNRLVLEACFPQLPKAYGDDRPLEEKK